MTLRLKEVLSVYPDARVQVVLGKRGKSGGGLDLRPSPAPVKARPSEVVPISIGAPAQLGELPTEWKPRGG